MAEIEKVITSLDAEPPRWEAAIYYVVFMVVVIGCAYGLHSAFPSMKGDHVEFCVYLGLFGVMLGIFLALKLWRRRVSKRIERNERAWLTRMEAEKARDKQ
jgi:membrane associated rhomboid family serine protease